VRQSPRCPSAGREQHARLAWHWRTHGDRGACHAVAAVGSSHSISRVQLAYPPGLRAEVRHLYALKRSPARPDVAWFGVAIR
jgi:hypothetical protein